ncbi:alpha-mannosidase [Paeniglutamicibacter antarcticus]|uniref:Glycoside hydrolase family 38 C-terminal domain-containing protein n=1 Tax=Paeniglutamicibacter antarcticus TaxID=494023 RepID=A0ABP9TKQ8_9MICC
MHDDTALSTARARRVLDERILPAIYPFRAALEVASHQLPAEPIDPAEAMGLGYAPYSVGTPWGPAWGTTWFRVRGEVPADWAGKRVEALIDLGFDPSMTGFQCEGLVHRRDGHTVKSINPRNQWVPVAESAEGGESVEFFIEAASNPVLLEHHPFLPTDEGDILTSSPRPLYTTGAMDLAVRDTAVYELSLDIEVLLELQAELPEGPRRARILQGLDDALDVLDLTRIGATSAAARAVLAPILAQPAGASAHRLAAIGHAHIDSAWLWPIRETVRKVARTTSSMLELLDADPEFIYGMSSAQQYKWLKEHRPTLFGRVKQAVSDSRFVPLGGMWVESDTVMPSGESLVRQFLHGQRFFEEEFGITCHGAWLPDSFGYSPALPQIMRRAGLDWFFTQKISWNQTNIFPHHSFDWEGIDGSRIPTHFPPMDTYNSQLSGHEVALASRQFRESRRATGSIAPVGWGDGGGGTTREMADKARRLANLEGSARVEWEHPDAFFKRTGTEMPDPPVWVGELYLELHRATLTSQHRTKEGNRRSEHLLVEAELWAATAAVRTGFGYPHQELDALWESVLLHQFHDILPGTSIAWVHREVVAEYERIIATAESIIAAAHASLLGSGATYFVLNPAASTRNGVPPGGSLPLSGLGTPGPAVDARQQPEGFELDNGLIAIRITSNGLISSAIDLSTGRDAIAPGQHGNLLQLHQDFPNKWDAWDVDAFYRNRATDLRDVDAISLSTDPDGSARLTVARSFSNSTLTQELVLCPGSRMLKIVQHTNWRETEKFLKVSFPLDIRAEQSIAETQFGYHRRPTHVNTSWEAAKFETSMHRFVLLEEPGFGAALINDSIYGFDVTREVENARTTTTARLSLLRAPRFPDPHTDQGEQTHRYGLLVGADTASATEAGILMNAAQRVVCGAHGFDPLVDLQGEGLLLSVVKLAADRSGDVIVRLYESLGRRASGTLGINADVESVSTVSLLEDPLSGAPHTSADLLDRIDGRVELALGAFEVRTLRLRLST